MTGTVIASDDAQRNLVTGGIFRISSMKDITEECSSREDVRLVLTSGQPVTDPGGGSAKKCLRATTVVLGA